MPTPPDGPNDADDSSILYVQGPGVGGGGGAGGDGGGGAGGGGVGGGGGPACCSCAIVIRWPPIVSSAVRRDPLLGITPTRIVASPSPAVGEGVAHEALVEAVQRHAECVRT